jgi:DNA polymerase III alpha subunit
MLHAKHGDETKQLTREQVFDMFEGDDFTYKERLEAQLEYLGYHWDSPMDVFLYKSENTIANVKQSSAGGDLDCIVSKFDLRKTKNGNRYVSLLINDGSETARVNIWSDQAAEYDSGEFFDEGVGLRMRVEYNTVYHSFNLTGKIRKLKKVEDMTTREGPDGTLYLEEL